MSMNCCCYYRRQNQEIHGGGLSHKGELGMKTTSYIALWQEISQNFGLNLLIHYKKIYKTAIPNKSLDRPGPGPALII